MRKKPKPGAKRKLPYIARKRISSGKTRVSPELTGINSELTPVNPELTPDLPPGKQNSGILDSKIRDKSGTPVAGSGGVFPDKPIGPGNPPAKNTFKPGQSGNPKGYPKGKPNAKTVIAYWLGQTEEIDNPLTGQRETITQLDAITLRLLQEARKGNVAAFRELVDRTEGKPVQSTKLLDHNDKALEVTIGFKRPGAQPPAKKDYNKE